MPGTSGRNWRILIVEDHPITREGCERLLEMEPDMEVAGTAAGTRKAMAFLQANAADLALVDLGLCDGNGLEFVRQVAAKYPKMPVLVWTARDEAVYAERALEAGARGFINKRALSRTLVKAVRTVLAGKTYLSENAKDLLVARRYNSSSASPLSDLSNRELEIFELLGEGWTVKEIADSLCVSTKTVNSYRERIKSKVGVDSSRELDRIAFQWNLNEAGGNTDKAFD